MPKISLEAARVNAKLTQKELAEILGVSNVTIVNWEKGKSEPDASQLRKISELSGIPLDFIFVPDRFNWIEFCGTEANITKKKNYMPYSHKNFFSKRNSTKW